MVAALALEIAFPDKNSHAAFGKHGRRNPRDRGFKDRRKSFTETPLDGVFEVHLREVAII